MQILSISTLILILHDHVLFLFFYLKKIAFALKTHWLLYTLPHDGLASLTNV